MRCNNCNKFVSQELAEPEVESVDLDDSVVTCQVRIVVQCQECGDDLKEASLYMEAEISGDIYDAHHDEAHIREGHELSVDEGDVESIDEYKDKDRYGKPIRSMRYRTHMYGARVTGLIRCDCKADTILEEVTLEEKIEAGSMDSCQ